MSLLEPLWREQIDLNQAPAVEQASVGLRSMVPSVDSQQEIVDIFRTFRSGLLNGRAFLARQDSHITHLYNDRTRLLRHERSVSQRAYDVYILLRHVLAAFCVKVGI